MEHNLFKGGARAQNYPFSSDSILYPQVEQGPHDKHDLAAHQTPTEVSLTTRYDFGGRDLLRRNIGSDNNATSFKGSVALAAYLKHNPIAAGDIINVAMLPKFTELTRVHWAVDAALTGFTFDLQVRGNGLGGPLMLAAGVSGAVVDHGVLDAYAINGAPVYFKENDMLQLVVQGLPASGIGPDMSDPESVGAIFEISPVLKQFRLGWF